MLTAGSVQYEYDERGNLKKEIDGSQIAQYNYDAANRLANVIMPDGTTITNTYDADGRRVKQVTGVQVTSYLWDETSLYGDVVLETTSGVNTSYVLAGSGLISQTKSGVTSFYLQDGQGSTRNLTDSSGNVTDSYSYTAFGEIYNQTGTTENKYLYTGQQYDSGLGLYSLRARYYDPSNGRFLSQDTYSVNFSNPIELNRYGYVAGNPVNLSDPSGYTSAESAFGNYFGVKNNNNTFAKVYVPFAVGITAIIAFGLFYAMQADVGTLPFPRGGAGGGDDGSVWQNIRNGVVGLLALLIYLQTQVGDIEDIDINDESDREQKPIVLDLGPGNNFEGEIRPLLNHYGSDYKVIAIQEIGWHDSRYIRQYFSADIAKDNFDVIQGSYSTPTILAQNGYTQCASVIYSFWPDRRGVQDLPAALENFLCTGGSFYIVTEEYGMAYDFKSSLSNSLNINRIIEISRERLANGTSHIGIPVSSEFSKEFNYIVSGTKK